MQFYKDNNIKINNIKISKPQGKFQKSKMTTLLLDEGRGRSDLTG